MPSDRALAVILTDLRRAAIRVRVTQSRGTPGVRPNVPAATLPVPGTNPRDAGGRPRACLCHVGGSTSPVFLSLLLDRSRAEPLISGAGPSGTGPLCASLRLQTMRAQHDAARRVPRLSATPTPSAGRRGARRGRPAGRRARRRWFPVRGSRGPGSWRRGRRRLPAGGKEWVVDESGEVEDGLVTDGDAGEVHGHGALLRSIGILTGSAVARSEPTSETRA